MLRLPEKLAALRKHYSYSQSYIADLLDVDVLVYMNYENGSDVPSFDSLKILAKFYKIPIETLFIEDEKLDLTDDAYDIDKENYTYLKRQAKKEKYLHFLKRRYKTIILIMVIILLLSVALILLPKGSEGLTLVHSSHPNDLLDASDRSVVYIDSTGTPHGRGDNTNSQLDLDFSDVIEIKEGNNFTVALKSDGTIVSAGLITRIADELALLTDIVKVEAGDDHIVTLDTKGDVTCHSTYGAEACAIAGSHHVVDIFADDDVVIAIYEDGSVESFGDFLGKDCLADIGRITDMAISDTISAFIVDEKLVYYSDGQDFDELRDLTGLRQVAVGYDFIAVLDAEDKVHIAIAENFILEEEVASWNDVKAIASGKDYLVALIGDEIVGVGNNDYDQFDVESSQKITLASVSNVRISYTETDLVIEFDPVSNASAYNLRIDVGTGIAMTTTSTSFSIPLGRFTDGSDYTIEIIAKGDQTYDDSVPTIVNLRFRDPNALPEDTENPEDQELITLTQMTSMSEEEFLNYLDSLEVDMTRVGRYTTDIVCTGDEITITSISGISDFETLTREELMSRDIVYYVCKVTEDDGNEDMADQGTTEQPEAF